MDNEISDKIKNLSDKIENHMAHTGMMDTKLTSEKSEILNIAQKLHHKLKQYRPEERSEKSRKFAIAITETEKLIAYLLTI